MPDGDPLRVVLDAIADIGEVMAAVETETLVLVTEAHFRGASWADIGRRLDRTRQSVHQRYQGRVHATRTRELLARDLTEALGRARELSRLGPVNQEAAESRAFLREWAPRQRPANPLRVGSGSTRHAGIGGAGG